MPKTIRFFRRYLPIITLALLNLVVFLALIFTRAYVLLSLSSLVQELTSLMGIMLGLTFTTFSILIGIVPIIEEKVKNNNAFKSIGKVILTATGAEVIALIFGLASTGIKVLSKAERTSIELTTLYFSFLSITLILLISYYLYLTFAYVSSDGN